MTHSRAKDFRLIRPLVFVNEKITAEFAAAMGAPVIPCGCSQRAGTVRRSLRGLFAGLEAEYPHLQETLLTAMGKVELGRLLDTRYLDLEGAEAELLPVLDD